MEIQLHGPSRHQRIRAALEEDPEAHRPLVRVVGAADDHAERRHALGPLVLASALLERLHGDVIADSGKHSSWQLIEAELLE